MDIPEIARRAKLRLLLCHKQSIVFQRLIHNLPVGEVVDVLG